MNYFRCYFITTVSILSLSVWSSAPPLTDGSESGPSEHIKIPRHLSPLSSLSVDSVHHVVLAKLSYVDAVEVVGSESGVAFGALPLASVVTGLQAFVAEDVETFGEDGLLVPGVTTRTPQFSLAGRRQLVAQSNTVS